MRVQFQGQICSLIAILYSRSQKNRLKMKMRIKTDPDLVQIRKFKTM
jgi:hypothetical protein